MRTNEHTIERSIPRNISTCRCRFSFLNLHNHSTTNILYFKHTTSGIANAEISSIASQILFATSYTGYQFSTGIHDKIRLLVYKCLRGTAPPYLVEECIPIAVNSARSSMRSPTNRDLIRPRTNLVRYGQRSFSVISPRT